MESTPRLDTSPTDLWTPYLYLVTTPPQVIIHDQNPLFDFVFYSVTSLDESLHCVNCMNESRTGCKIWFWTGQFLEVSLNSNKRRTSVCAKRTLNNDAAVFIKISLLVKVAVTNLFRKWRNRIAWSFRSDVTRDASGLGRSATDPVWCTLILRLKYIFGVNN